MCEDSTVGRSDEPLGRAVFSLSYHSVLVNPPDRDIAAAIKHRHHSIAPSLNRRQYFYRTRPFCTSSSRVCFDMQLLAKPKRVNSATVASIDGVARPIAIVTPSFSRDFDLCRTLNRSVLEFLPSNVRHYIFVDRRDYELFASLRGPRTVVATKEEVMPRGIVQVPGTNRWFSTGTLLPISGWLVQQIAKIATAAVLDESTLVMVDSDAVFVRDVDVSLFARDERTRLFRDSKGINAAMPSHIRWHRNASSLLGIPPQALPLDDYIGQVITWNRALVLDMCARVESVTGLRWFHAVARARQFSEYLLYGLYAENFASPRRFWIDENTRCGSRWESSPLDDVDLQEFVDSLQRDDIALMISAHSRTTPEIRRLAIDRATGGRIT